MTPNPFSPTAILADQQGVFGDARLIRSSFLFRVIEFETPIPFRMVYDGWWFRQKIEIDGQVAWFRISWLTIHRRVEFQLPDSTDPQQSPVTIEIEFGQGLKIGRFRVWISQQIAYDEIN